MELTFQTLKMAILTGVLKPRERLVESDLISRFTLKRFAVRKAIQELAHQGFVDFTPNKGARVVDLSDKDVEDIYQVRMNLELLAAELMIERLTPQKLTRLKQAQKAYLKGVKEGVLEEMVSRNEAFHRTLYEMTDNPFLVEHLERLTHRVFALRYHAYFLLGIAEKTVNDHEAVIRALEQRNLEKLKRITKESIIYPKMIYLSRKMGFSYPAADLNADGKRGKKGEVKDGKTVCRGGRVPSVTGRESVGTHRCPRRERSRMR